MINAMRIMKSMWIKSSPSGKAFGLVMRLFCRSLSVQARLKTTENSCSQHLGPCSWTISCLQTSHGVGAGHSCSTPSGTSFHRSSVHLEPGVFQRRSREPANSLKSGRLGKMLKTASDRARMVAISSHFAMAQRKAKLGFENLECVPCRSV